MGYLYDNDKTMEVIDKDEWLHSGDIGHTDNEEYYFITGRSKEIWITQDGRNIAYIFIEKEMKKSMPILSKVMVIGDEKQHLIMFVTLKCQLDGNKPTDKLDPDAIKELQGIGCKATIVHGAVGSPKVFDYIQTKMEGVNAQIGTSVRKFQILPKDFSVDGGELTAIGDMKRDKILEKYHDLVEQMYAELS